MVGNITSVHASNLIRSNAKVIDIRDKNEFKKSHINGAVNIGIDEVEKILKLFPNKNEKIIVVCSKGIRSIAVAEELSDMGYKNVYNLMDGYDKYKKGGR